LISIGTAKGGMYYNKTYITLHHQQQPIHVAAKVVSLQADPIPYR